MKITEKFLGAIKQISDVTDNVILEQGNTILVKGSPKLKVSGLVCQANLDIDIPDSAGVSDTKQFQNLIGLFDREDLEIEFKDQHFVFQDGTSKSRFVTSPTSLLDSKPKYNWKEYEELFFQDPICEVEISSALFNHVIKAKNGINAKAVSVLCKDGVLQFLCHNHEDPNGNTFSIPIKEDSTLPNFQYVIDSFLIGAIAVADYTMKVSSERQVISLTNPDFNFLVSGLPTFSVAPE